MKTKSLYIYIPLLGLSRIFVVSQDCVVFSYMPLGNLYDTQD